MVEPILLSAEEARDLSKSADIHVQEILKQIDTAIRGMCSAGKTSTTIGELHENFRMFKPAGAGLRELTITAFAKKVIEEIEKRGFRAYFAKEGEVYDARPTWGVGPEDHTEPNWMQKWSLKVCW
jgi:hypothetical protein